MKKKGLHEKGESTRIVTGPFYTPERDGKLGEYLERMTLGLREPLFRGVEDYEMLKSLGLLIPDFTIVRYMWNYGRQDEHFLVDSNFNLVGIRHIAAHRGEEGTHDPKVKLGAKNDPKNENFEISNINQDVLRELVEKGV